MDLWDLARLLFRRWYFALPILLVSAITAVFVSQSVEPDYRATGNVVMIPAPGDPADAAAAAAGKAAPTRPKNPWLDLGFEALGNAAILKVQDQNTLAEFTRAGLSESITVQMAIRSPIFVIEAVGRTPAQATATVREVIKVLAAEVAAQQLSYGALPQDTITTRTLTDGADVQTVTSKVKRVLIVTVGLGLLLTAAGTIGLDVLIRWRRNRRRATGTARVAAAAGGGVDGGDPDDGDRADGRGIRPRFLPTRSSSEETQIISRVPATNGNAETAVQLAKVSGPAAGRAPSRSAGRSAVRAEAEVRNSGRRSVDAEENGSKPKRQPAADATIILPVPRSSWSEHDDRNGGR